MPVIFDHGKFALTSPEFRWPDTGRDRSYSNPIERSAGVLVLELARVGWDAPGIDVEIRTHGQGENLFRCVRKISGVTEAGPFCLRFSTHQGRTGPFGIPTGLSEATIPPGIEIIYYGEGSGPTGYLYLGKDWKSEGAEWMNALKVNSKLYKKPKTYLRYSGRGNRGIMPHDNDLGREYSPTDSEPTSMDSDEVAAKVIKFVDGLIAKLSQMPSAPGFDDVTHQGDANLRRLSAVEPIAAPADFPLLYAWLDHGDARRLEQIAEEDSHNRYGLSGNGWRLCAYGSWVGELPDRACDGFSYASADPAVKAGHVVHRVWVSENHSPVVVKLKWLNDIFVVDNAAYDHAVKEMRTKIRVERRDRMTDAELDQCIAATARTLTPVTEYVGGFEKPIYLIGRQIQTDEARLAKGSVELSQTADKLTVVIRDKETGREFEAFSRESIGDRSIAIAKRTAEEYAFLHAPNGHYRDLLSGGVAPVAADEERGLCT